MKFLWVEDFGDDSESQDIDQETWEAYFGISDNELCYTLEDALIFLDNNENRSKFDVVLLDIRFPVLSENSVYTEELIYENYFSGFLTKKQYDYYSNYENKTVGNASSGILLFLALIYRYGYNWNNIAFISANIDDGNVDGIVYLKEMLTKLEYEESLTRTEQTIYNSYIFKIKRDIGCSSALDLCEYGEVKTRQTIQEQTKILNRLQEKINKAAPKAGLKYCSIRNQFEEIGLRMPAAFEKPKENLDKCWLFYKWKKIRADEFMILKRELIDICSYLKNEIHGNTIKFLAQQHNYNDPDSELTETTIGQYLEDIIQKATDVPVVRTRENIERFNRELVSIIVSIWESINIPVTKLKNEDEYIWFACFSALKLSRNWMSHQRIHGIDTQFAAFLFIVSIRGIFDFDNMCDNVRDEIVKHENNLQSIMLGNDISYDGLDINAVLEEKYKKLFDDVKDAIPEGYDSSGKGKMRLPDKAYNPYGLCSALGHIDSLKREKVSVNDIYRAFWLTIHYGNENTSAICHIKAENNSIRLLLEKIYGYI